MPADRTKGPVVLLGFDAADPDLVERWAREGKLPAMASLMARGTWARTSGEELLFEHGVWSSLLSGVSVARHGFHFFWQPVPGSYALELYHRATHARNIAFQAPRYLAQARAPAAGGEVLSS